MALDCPCLVALICLVENMLELKCNDQSHVVHLLCWMNRLCSKCGVGALHINLAALAVLQVRALYAFDAEAEGELSVAVGDSLWVETEVDGWYQVVRDGDGARGLVPSSYVDVEQF